MDETVRVESILSDLNAELPGVWVQPVKLKMLKSDLMVR